MSSQYSTLRKSRTYIVVPRNVPPENFLSVPETQKERKTGLVRCVLIPVLVLLVIAGLLSGLGCLVYGYHSRQKTVKWTGREEQDDEPSAAYEYTQLTVDQITTFVVYTFHFCFAFHIFPLGLNQRTFTLHYADKCSISHILSLF